jgi:hypothetical protein
VLELTKAGASISISGTPAPPDQPQPGLRYVLADGSTDLDVFLTGGPGVFPSKGVGS